MDREKVGIFTLNGYYNYGNRLQLFALTRILSSMNYSSSVYWPKKIGVRIKHFLKYKTMLKRRYPKDMKFVRFTKMYLPKITSCKDVKCCIVGSDQVWNPEYLENHPYLLSVPNNNKIISYAASIGAEVLTTDQKKVFQKELEKYTAISVRESSAKDLLQPLTLKNVEVVLDPTLLLDVEEYEKIETAPMDLRPNEKYILNYVLGRRDYDGVIKKFAEANGYRIINCSDKRDSDYGVEEYLYLVHHARLICTDSFHACVFSFIFERPFLAFRRKGKEDYMYSRLQSFMGSFRLGNHEYNGGDITDGILSVDYTNSKKILAKKQKESLTFLRDALDGKNEC